MKALVYFGPHDIRYTDVETPKPKPDEVLIKVRAVSICGSDISGYKGQSAMRVPPLIMGHEFSGEIVGFGETVSGFTAGDRVVVLTNLFCDGCADCKDGLTNVCDNRKIIGTTMLAGSYNGAMADYVVAPAEKVLLLPRHISFNEAALIEPLAISLRAVKHAGSLPDKTVAVYGAGPIGLLAIQCIKNAGAKRIVAIEQNNDARLAMAIRCGATDTLNEKDDILARINEITNRAGMDIVFDAAGVEATVNGSVDIIRNGGTIIWIGLAAARIEFDFKHAVCKEITIQSTYMYTTEMEEGLELLKTGKIDAGRIITGVYPLSEGPRIFEEVARGTSQEIKIILTDA